MQYFLGLALLLSLLTCQAQAREIVGFLVPVAGLGDQSFNDMTYSGLIKARNRHQFTLIREQCRGGTEGDRQQAMEQLITRGADIIVVNGWQYRNLVRTFAEKYPMRRFLLHDYPLRGMANVVSTEFAQQEGGFLAGALAGWMTRSGRIGFIGGVDLPGIRDFLAGYRQGATYAKPEVKLSEAFLAPAQDIATGFASPSLGFGNARRMFDSGVDVIFGAAGMSGQGIIQAALRHRKFVIGADADQDHLAQGLVLTSVMIRLDTVTADILDRMLRGEPLSGSIRYGLREGGITLSPMTYTREVISRDIQQRLQLLRQQIVDGKIVVKPEPVDR